MKIGIPKSLIIIAACCLIVQTAAVPAGLAVTVEAGDSAPFFEVAAIVTVVQGIKHCYIGEKKYVSRPGNVQVMFFPMETG